jgi:putative tricarboxylic transport membrane protein
MLLCRNFALAPMVLGFILGPMVESNFRTAVIAGRGSVMGFFSHPIAIGLVVFGILMVAMDSIRGLRKKPAA